MGAGDPMNNLREEFISALQAGAPERELLAIVRRHKASGVGQRATYDTLESIRAELGCSQDGAQENPLCERLEDVMDYVWGFCNPAEAIWESSLSDVGAK
jgi:hypothetical protein